MIVRTLRLNRPVLLATALLALALALVAPTAASALVYEVDSTADEADEDPGAGGCETAGGACTLRAALEESNNSAEIDEVTFISAFDGKSGDTITLTLGDVLVNEPVLIEGDQAGEPCETSAAVKGPCVEVTGGGFNVEGAEGVTIRGLAITGALDAIDVLNESTIFTAQNDWLGVKLNGTAGANNAGIFLDPGSDAATIGGTEPALRNVFGNNNNEGLDIQGAGFAVVRGNYFGVAPNGKTQAANGKDIEVTDSTAGGGFKAEGNEIGGIVAGEAATSVPCDGACNVISGSLSYGIDLQGNGGEEVPASGSTVIRGNYIGMTASGGEVLGNVTAGIVLGAAKKVTIGGPSLGEENHLNGGLYGILAGPGTEKLKIDSNLIGVTVPGTSTFQPPSEAGLSISSEGLLSIANQALIRNNEISMLGGVGIVQHSVGAWILENEVFGGVIGIRTFGSVGPEGNRIEENMVQNATEFALLLENDSNRVLANQIGNTGGAGIHIGPSILAGPASGNVIGGDLPAAENTIFGNAGDAIEIVGEESIQNEVRRNDGEGNGGLFIDLGANGVGNSASTGPNGGIQAPAISSATVSGASGTAEPGAKVRVFRKATTSDGELQEFLAEATANGSGSWSATYGAAIPAGTIVAASQTTSAKGTSELTAATTVAPPSGGGGGGGGGGNGGKDTTPPDTRITKAPPKRTHKTTVKFKFVSTEAGSTFECKLDRKPFKKCSSPKTYKKVKPGKHVFKVRAIDKAGNVDPTPAKRKFTVLR